MKILHLLTLAAGVPLLGFLIYHIGPLAIWQQFTLLGWALIVIILLEGMSNLFHTQGWRHCLSGSRQSLSFGRVFCVLLAGGSINYLTPTAGLGGEVTKGFLLSSDQTGPQAASAVLLDKLSRVLAELILITMGCIMFLINVAIPRAMWLTLIPVTAVLGAGLIGFLLVQKYGKLGSVVRWAVRHRIGGASLRKTAESMTDVDGELSRFYRTRPHDMALSIFWHFVGLLWAVIPTYYFLVLTRGEATPSTAGALVVLGTWFDVVSFAVPVDIGVQEATRVLAFKLVGLPTALGLTYGITRRLQQLFWAGIGLALYGLLVSNRFQPSPQSNRIRPQGEIR